MEIVDRHPQGLTSFTAPPTDNYLAGMAAGEVTDGTSQLLLLSDVLNKHGLGKAQQQYRAALSHWMQTSEFTRFVGRTTAQAIDDGPPTPDDNPASSNGAAMRIAPVGWRVDGNIDEAVARAAGIAGLTHIGAGVVGACMIAAAVTTAVVGKDLDGVIDAARASIAPASDLARAPESGKAMRQAFEESVSAGRSASTFTTLNERLNAFDVPTTTAATGSVAAVFGLLTAAQGRTFEAITMAVNAGDDTHTTAMMTGAIAGALSGSEDIPSTLLQQLVEVNGRLHGIDFAKVVVQ